MKTATKKIVGKELVVTHTKKSPKTPKLNMSAANAVRLNKTIKNYLFSKNEQGDYRILEHIGKLAILRAYGGEVKDLYKELYKSIPVRTNRIKATTSLLNVINNRTNPDHSFESCENVFQRFVVQIKRDKVENLDYLNATTPRYLKAFNSKDKLLPKHVILKIYPRRFFCDSSCAPVTLTTLDILNYLTKLGFKYNDLKIETPLPYNEDLKKFIEANNL